MWGALQFDRTFTHQDIAYIIASCARTVRGLDHGDWPCWRAVLSMRRSFTLMQR